MYPPLETEVLSIKQAQQHMLEQARLPSQTECCQLSDALDRVLATSITSSIDVPPFNASAMDGFALNSKDAILADTTLPLSQTIAAGDTPSTLKVNTAARILTGAPLPQGADTVIIQENCIANPHEVRFLKTAKSGDNIRPQGSHIAVGQNVLDSGLRIRAVDIGLLASMGKSCLDVYPTLRIGVLSTGCELVNPGTPLQPGKIHNSNHAMLISLISQLNCRVIDLGSIEDDFLITHQALSDAQDKCDIIISSGGVSVGDKDHVKTALDNLGFIHFWKINMKPGKPVAFGKLGSTDFIGLPGNPVSCFVTFCLLARPFILKRLGIINSQIVSQTALSNFTQRTPGKRTEYKRVTTIIDKDGHYIATPYPKQDSATLMSISQCDGLLEVPGGIAIKPGVRLNYYPFSTLLS